MSTTHEGRILSFTPVLGKDYLLINEFSVEESISKLYTIYAELLHEEVTESYEPTVIDPQKLLGKPVSIKLEASDGSGRYFSGMINSFTQGNRHTRFSHYHITIVPHVWMLTQKSQSRIFQQMNVPEILKKVFDGFDVKFELQGTFEQRNYCVQYRETDFAFASRLMEEEGIFYFFEHGETKEQMIIANTPQSHRQCPGKNQVPFFVKVGEQEDFVGAVNTFVSGYNLQSGKVAMWDHNFQLPTSKLDHEQQSRFTFGENKKLEVYDFPGGYARKYDGIDKGGGVQSGELQKVFPDRDSTLRNAIEALDARVTSVFGTSDVGSFIAGFRFELLNHPNSGLNKQYVLTSVSHSAQQNPAYVSNEGATYPYTNQFNCIPYGAGQPTFRPLRSTSKPVVHGSQTAIVVGPAGEEIFTDKYGRIKVQFHWDREGQADAGSSCWVRVAQTWAGNKWGGMYIPRVGMEVLVHFMEGDPDQPIVTGCVYNPQSMPPYTLPDEKTKSTIKSNSSKGGGGFNEFRIEDKKGSEQIFIHAERNQDNRVKNDSLEWVGHDRHLIIKNEQFEKVEKDKHLQVSGDHNETIGSDMSVTVGVNMQEKAGNNYALEAGSGVHIKAGISAVIEAGTSITLKVGGSSININSGGIQIIGSPMLLLNSGGSALSGAGCNPERPKDPKEADKAEAGQETQEARKRPPPASPGFNQCAAEAQKSAKKKKSNASKKNARQQRQQMAETIKKMMEAAQAEMLKQQGKEIATQIAKSLVAVADGLPFVHHERDKQEMIKEAYERSEESGKPEEVYPGGPKVQKVTLPMTDEEFAKLPKEKREEMTQRAYKRSEKSGKPEAIYPGGPKVQTIFLPPKNKEEATEQAQKTGKPVNYPCGEGMTCSVVPLKK